MNFAKLYIFLFKCNEPVKNDLYFVQQNNNQSFKKKNNKVLNEPIDKIYKNFDSLDLTDEINHLLLIFKHIFPSESLNHATIAQEAAQLLDSFQDEDLLNDNFMDSLNELLESTQTTFVDTFCDSSQSSFCSLPSTKSNIPQLTSTQQTTSSDDPFDGLIALSTTTSNSSIEIVKMTHEEKLKYYRNDALKVNNNENKQAIVKSERKRRISDVDSNEDDEKSMNQDEELWWEKGKKPRMQRKSKLQTSQKTTPTRVDQRLAFKEKGALLKDALIKETSKSLLLKNSLLNQKPSNSPRATHIPSGYKDLVLNVLKKKQIN
jgi:hypothetical protein